MAKLLVTYDLNNPGQNYYALYDYLSEYDHIHPMESVWIIRTNKDCKSVRNEILSQILDPNDKLYIANVDRSSAWHGFTNQETAWIKK